jgi:protein-S-isoprenylcysteine O-methyltransferase Ste14
MALVGTIIVACWIVLLLYWTISAFSQKKSKEKSPLKSRVGYSLLLLISYLLLLFSYKIFPLSYILINGSYFVNFLSIFLCLFGLIISLFARRVLGNNWSRDVMIKENHQLITSGPYKYIRHPIYLGLLLLFLGTALAIGNLGGLLGFILLFFNFRRKYMAEEALMIKCFKKKYLEYIRKTKAMIPYVY